MKNSKISCLALLFSLFFIGEACANIVFPAISHQFMISMVVRSYYSVVMAVLILIVEAFFIRKLFAVNFIWSFLVSFAINLISSLIGIILTGVLFGKGSLTGIFGVLGYRNMRLGTYLGLVPGYLLTVILEGLLLVLIALLVRKKLGIRAIFKTSLVMNVYSYIIIALGVLIADIISKGAVFKTY